MSMHLKCCKPNHVPQDAIYIGRKMGRIRASVLANPYVAIDPERPAAETRNAVAVPDPIERYRRRITCEVVEHHDTLRALRELPATATLACWCVDRPAALLRRGLALPERLCHGDVIFTVWTTLESMNWDIPRVDFRGDFQAANRAWAGLYEQCFAESMKWRNGYQTSEGMRREPLVGGLAIRESA